MLMKSASQPPLLPLHDLFADWSGAGEAQLADVWVVGESLTHHAAWRRTQPIGVTLLCVIHSDLSLMHQC